MSTLPPIRRCSVCSAEIPADAPQALCPKCLLLGVAAAGELPGSEPGTRYSPGASPVEQRRGRDVEGRAPAPSIEEIAPAFPQLQIIELIGRGGMGYVYKAKQPKLDRLVALKILPGHLANEPSFHERFEREARVLAKLQHPAIVTVYDFGEAIGITRQESSERYFYLLLEYVDGVNLREAMRAGRFTPEQALAIVPQVCEALQYAHSKGVLHRDIKPENILLDTEGHVKIADFGIAKVLDPEIESSISKFQGRGVSESERAVTRLTATGSVLGTPLYMAPEQLLRPDAVDHRADIFSLGVVFYEMLTGELPMGRFAPPSEKSLVDQRIDEVVLRALAKERELRQQSANEMKTEVETIASHPQDAGKNASPPAGTRAGRLPSLRQAVYVPHEINWSRRFYWLVACVVAVFVIPPVLFLVVLFASYLQMEQRSVPSMVRTPQMMDMQEYSKASMPRAPQMRPTLPQDLSVPDGSPEFGGAPPQMGMGAPRTPSADITLHPVDPRETAVPSSAEIEAKRLGLLEAVRFPTDVRIDQQPISLLGLDKEVQIEPHFSALVQLPYATTQLLWTFTSNRFSGQTSNGFVGVPYPCDYVACDWSSGQDRPIIIGYILPPGSYDFRADAELEKLLRSFNSKDRSDLAVLVLKLTKEATQTSSAVSTDWQKSAQAAHFRFRLVPKSISHLDVPEECLVELQKDSRTIFTRNGGQFTKYTISSTEAMRAILEVFERVENRDEREAEAQRNRETRTSESQDSKSSPDVPLDSKSNDKSNPDVPK